MSGWIRAESGFLSGLREGKAAFDGGAALAAHSSLVRY